MFLGTTCAATNATSSWIDDSSASPDQREANHPPTETRAQWLERAILPHAPALRSMLRRKYPNVDADDVLQATYLRLMATEQVDHIDNDKFYFFRVAMSQIAQQARRDDLVQFESFDQDSDDRGSDDPTMESVIDSERAWERFLEILRGLPQRQRLVIELRRFEGLGVRSTAERLALSVSAVEKLQLTALRQLSAALAHL